MPSTPYSFQCRLRSRLVTDRPSGPLAPSGCRTRASKPPQSPRAYDTPGVHVQRKKGLGRIVEPPVENGLAAGRLTADGSRPTTGRSAVRRGIRRRRDVGAGCSGNLWCLYETRAKPDQAVKMKQNVGNVKWKWKWKQVDESHCLFWNLELEVWCNYLILTNAVRRQQTAMISNLA
ncbi:hypothetical protein E4U22_007651 [Claviceps purpurea]|nr:hypothetical protein E4U22_007651 [Claviceps purpurea]